MSVEKRCPVGGGSPLGLFVPDQWARRPERCAKCGILEDEHLVQVPGDGSWMPLRESRRLAPKLCGVVMVGQGGDTWDPVCTLGHGHAGPHGSPLLEAPTEKRHQRIRNAMAVGHLTEADVQTLARLGDDPTTDWILGLIERAAAKGVW